MITSPSSPPETLSATPPLHHERVMAGRLLWDEQVLPLCSRVSFGVAFLIALQLAPGQVFLEKKALSWAGWAHHPLQSLLED